MAKLGEGDPRWLVQERADGANVNNWHWTELDCSAWAKDRLTSLLKTIDETKDDCAFKITVESVTGEASVNTRKGKVLFFYELEAKLKYEANFKDDSKTYEGKIHIPYIGDENADGEYEIKINADGSSANDEKMKQILKTHGYAVIKEKVMQFLRELREEKGPKNLKPTPTSPPPVAQPAAKPTTQATSSVTTKETSRSSVEIKNLDTKIKLRGPLGEVFSCFLDPNRVSAFTQSPTVLSSAPGSPFSLYGGAITGETLEVVNNTKIVQKWRMNDWPDNHFSQVTMKFETSKDGTTVQLIQTGIPVDSFERVRAGWDEKFWRRMKMMFGWGSLYGD